MHFITRIRHAALRLTGNSVTAKGDDQLKQTRIVGINYVIANISAPRKTERCLSIIDALCLVPGDSEKRFKLVAM